MTSKAQRQASADSIPWGAISRDIINFRDFGGLSSAYGRAIVVGRLFRSGHLGQVSAESQALLDAMNFALIADLRFPKERREAPSLWPRSSGIDRFYTEFYRSIPFDKHFRELFGALVARMVNQDGCTLIHCAVGKDRTGIFVALIQHILGASRQDIMADYMLSRDAAGLLKMIPEIRNRLRDRLKQNVSDEIARKMLGVEQGYLRAGLAEIEMRCGSIDGYLNSIGVGAALREALRARLIVRL
jgi:protein-tyrosine phosphatase